MRLTDIQTLILGLDINETFKYKLTVENLTSHNVDLYLNAHIGIPVYLHVGTVTAGANKEIENLVANISYTLRAAISGKPFEAYFDEQMFINNEAKRYDMVIKILE